MILVIVLSDQLLLLCAPKFECMGGYVKSSVFMTTRVDPSLYFFHVLSMLGL